MPNGETIGRHIIRSLETSLDRLEKAEKKGNMDKEADELFAELDLLISLLGGDTKEEEKV